MLYFVRLHAYLAHRNSPSLKLCMELVTVISIIMVIFFVITKVLGTFTFVVNFCTFVSLELTVDVSLICWCIFIFASPTGRGKRIECREQ